MYEPYILPPTPMERIAFYNLQAPAPELFCSYADNSMHFHPFPLGEATIRIMSLDTMRLSKFQSNVQQTLTLLQDMSTDSCDELRAKLQRKIDLICSFFGIDSFLFQLIVSIAATKLEHGIEMYSEISKNFTDDMLEIESLRANIRKIKSSDSRMHDPFLGNPYITDIAETILFSLAEWADCIWQYTIHGYYVLARYSYGELLFIDKVSDTHLKFFFSEIGMLQAITPEIRKLSDRVKLSNMQFPNAASGAFTKSTILDLSRESGRGLPFGYHFIIETCYSDFSVSAPIIGRSTNSILFFVWDELNAIQSLGFSLQTCSLCGHLFFCKSKDTRRCTNLNSEYGEIPCSLVPRIEIYRRKADPITYTLSMHKTRYKEWIQTQKNNNNRPDIQKAYIMTAHEINEIDEIFKEWSRHAEEICSNYHKGLISEKQALEDIKPPLPNGRGS